MLHWIRNCNSDCDIPNVATKSCADNIVLFYLLFCIQHVLKLLSIFSYLFIFYFWKLLLCSSTFSDNYFLLKSYIFIQPTHILKSLTNITQKRITVHLILMQIVKILFVSQFHASCIYQSFPLAHRFYKFIF